MTTIEVFADMVCPFTHVGLRRLIEARDARTAPALVRVRAWPLEWVNGQPLDPALAQREIDALRSRVAPDMFAGFDAARFPRTSIPAFGLAAAGYALDDCTGEAVSRAVRDALFEEGLDIADDEVLRALGARFGVEPFDLEMSASVVRADWERGQARGVRGSPHFFVGDRSWFCPSLVISHERDAFDINIAEDAMRDFYDVALS